jgi:pantoate--beta-alanine ligase
MERCETTAGMRDAVHRARERGETIGFVPTMGYLHAGHLALVDEARRRAGTVVVSIFVNPTQFGPNEDFARYPRDPEGDAAKLQQHGVDLIFTPSVEEMYPATPGVSVVADDLSNRWEGETRPGHFTGVLTVVAKLFNIVTPDIAVFGRKDLQQATLVRRMVRDLNVATSIVVAPTVREPDGLAMSSRNAYLQPPDRVQALALVGSLRAVVRAFAAGERRGGRLSDIGRDAFTRFPDARPDYFAIVDPDDMRPVEQATARSNAIVAARIGRTRLIDNATLGEPL